MEQDNQSGYIRIDGGKPLDFGEPPSGAIIPEHVKRMASTFRAYREASAELLNGKYAAFKTLAPTHIREASNIFVLECSDGVLVRWDACPDGNPKVRAGATPLSLAEVAPQFSEQLIHFPLDPRNYDPGMNGPELKGAVIDPSTGSSTEVMSLRLVMYGSVQLPDGFNIDPPPARPPCLVGMQNEIEFVMYGVVAPVNQPIQLEGPDVEQLVVRARITLPVGWRAIEIYPLLADEHWEPKFGRLWAELDILATVARRNLTDQQFRALDSRGETRARYAALLNEFEGLLAGPEEPVHQFLKSHPELLCPTSEQTWSKLAFGDTISDFVIREPRNDYLLVEIEAPIRELFRKDGQQRQELTHAIKQTTDWITYIQDNKQKVEEGLGLTGISTNPRNLVVIGRSEGLTDSNRRELTTIQNQHNKLRIMTYDDVLVAARANLERVLGPLALTAQNAELYFFKGTAPSQQ